MKRFTVSEARARFGDVLDAAEQEGDVIIERRGVQFVLRTQTAKSRPARRPSVIESLDPALEAGDWTWTWGRGGLRFRARPRR